GRSSFTLPVARRGPPIGVGLAARRRRRVVARATPGMTSAQPPDGEHAPPPGAVADQGFGGVLRTGRKKPALPPDQRRKRQLVGSQEPTDASLVEAHAGSGTCEVSPVPTPGPREVQATPAGVVRVPARVIAPRRTGAKKAAMSVRRCMAEPS